MEETEIQTKKTKDYDQFKYLQGNRKINKSHLRRLQESISKNNHLDIHPIIVNNNNEIVDGQHRFEAAKSLGLYIYYKKKESLEDSHVIDANVNQKSWEVENYIQYFHQRSENDDYRLINLMLKQSKLKPKALLCLLIGVVSKEILEFLKTGKYKLPQDRSYEKYFEKFLCFMDYVNDKRINPNSMFTNHYFTKAFRWLCNTQGFEFETFVKKLDLRWFDLKPQRGAEEWYKLLVFIYNFKNHNRIEEEYGK